MSLSRKLVAAALAAAAVALPAAAQNGHSPQWKRALHARSVALDLEYNLATPGWRSALRLRSEAANHRFGLSRRP
jgi:hypothetical protein